MTDALRDRVTAAVGDAYRVESEIGRGGMAVVYRAVDARLRRSVAIKVLPPELAFRTDVRVRFLREAQTAAQLNHPNIVPIYSVDERDGIVYFVMGLVDGESLAARLAREGPLPVSDARRILRDVADALSYAHAHGVIHRDVKPDNILLDRETGRPMVTDFGIARAAEADTRLTATGVAVGTPAYMSPEQALGQHDVDGRSDIYSLAVVAYQTLTGELPFRAASTPAMMMKHVSDVPPPVRDRRPDVPPQLEGAILRALGKRAEDRWPTAAAFRDAIVRDEAPRVPWQHTPPSVARVARPSGAVAVPAPAASPSRSAGQPGGNGGASHVPAPAAPAPGVVDWPAAAELRGLSRGQMKHQLRAAAELRGLSRGEIKRQLRADAKERLQSRPLDERITIFRRNLASTGVVVVMLAGINVLTSPQVPWFLFPALVMGASVMRHWSALWAEGVTWKRIFQRQQAPLGGGAAGAAAIEPGAPVDDPAARLAAPDVLAGTYGDAVRHAAADRATVLAIVGSLGKADRDLIPDVAPTVDALAKRAAAIAEMLHHMHTDVSPDALSQIDTRIDALRLESADAPDHERRLSLLERQRTSLRQLAARRERLVGQLDSVGIALQNLKLDLLRLRSSGVQSVLGDIASATVEARALSRDIEHVLEAADEVRKI